MKKEELIERLSDLIDTIEDDDREDFENREIEELIVEARIPITFSNNQ